MYTVLLLALLSGVAYYSLYVYTFICVHVLGCVSVSGQQVPVVSLWSRTSPYLPTALQPPLTQSSPSKQTANRVCTVFPPPRKELVQVFLPQVWVHHALNRLCSVEGCYSCAVIVRTIGTGTSQGNGRPKGGLVEPACTSSVRIPLRNLLSDMPGVLGPLHLLWVMMVL